MKRKSKTFNFNIIKEKDKEILTDVNKNEEEKKIISDKNENYAGLYSSIGSNKDKKDVLPDIGKYLLDKIKPKEDKKEETKENKNHEILINTTEIKNISNFEEKKNMDLIVKTSITNIDNNNDSEGEEEENLDFDFTLNDEQMPTE